MQLVAAFRDLTCVLGTLELAQADMHLFKPLVATTTCSAYGSMLLRARAHCGAAHSGREVGVGMNAPWVVEVSVGFHSWYFMLLKRAVSIHFQAQGIICYGHVLNVINTASHGSLQKNHRKGRLMQCEMGMAILPLQHHSPTGRPTLRALSCRSVL